MEWDEPIKSAWNGEVSDDFLASIWKVSTVDLPGLEVQVVVDSNDNLFISQGSPGFVSFNINPIGLKLPVKCWIHTHPFGFAYWSGIDWNTIDTWRPMMKKAIVLGKNQRGIWHQGEGYKWVWEDTATGRVVTKIDYQNDGRMLNDLEEEE